MSEKGMPVCRIATFNVHKNLGKEGEHVFNFINKAMLEKCFENKFDGIMPVLANMHDWDIIKIEEVNYFVGKKADIDKLWEYYTKDE